MNSATLKERQTQELIESHISYAHSIAKKFYRERKNISIELEDYIGAAMLGLCEAARRFDSSRGQNFKTYSFLRIRGAMYDLLRRCGGVSRTYFADLTSYESDSEPDTRSSRLPFAYARDSDELFNLSTIIEEFGIRIHRGGGLEQAEISYAGEHDPEQCASRQSTERYLRGLLAELGERDRSIIEKRYFMEQTFDEMREQFEGVSKSWLSRLHGRAIDSLRGRIEVDDRRCEARLERNAF